MVGGGGSAARGPIGPQLVSARLLACVIVARLLDLASTRWAIPALAPVAGHGYAEGNPLVAALGGGWPTLLVANLLLVGALAGLGIAARRRPVPLPPPGLPYARFVRAYHLGAAFGAPASWWAATRRAALRVPQGPALLEWLAHVLPAAALGASLTAASHNSLVALGRYPAPAAAWGGVAAVYLVGLVAAAVAQRRYLRAAFRRYVTR